MTDSKKDKQIKFSIDDYCLVESTSKKYLVLVTKKTDKICVGLNQKYYPYSEEEINFDANDVLANLGQKPSRLGYEVHYTSSRLQGIGDIHYFTKVGSSLRKEIKKVIEKGYKALEKKRLVSFFPLNFEVRPEKGSVAGYYKLDMKTDIDTMCFRITDQNDFKHCFYHEAGHGIYERLITSRSIKARWVALYNEFIEVQHLASSQIKQLYKNFSSSNMTLTEFKSSISEDEALTLVLKEIIAYIKKYHRLSIKDVDDLVQGEPKEIKKIWPNDSLSLSSAKETGITPYAAKAPKEFFCEAFAFHMTGKKLPREVRKLLDKTLVKAAS